MGWGFKIGPDYTYRLTKNEIKSHLNNGAHVFKIYKKIQLHGMQLDFA
jgi:hypothetical protein